MKHNFKIVAMAFVFGVAFGLILSLWWQMAQREHKYELQKEMRYEQD